MSQETFNVPTFAVVGKVNMGKSSVLATLLEVDDDRIIRVSSTPGETTQCQVLPLEFDGEERLRFIDTPGFSRPIEAMREIKNLHGENSSPNLEAIRAFLAKHESTGEFDDECQLLKPLVAGAGLLYIIDPSKPLRDDFIAEMEILRWTGRRRMALLNAKNDPQEHMQEWRERLGSYFNLVRTFNAHHARFDERRKLLKSLLEIDEDHAEMITTTIQFLDNEWQQRREESAEVIIDVLEKALLLRESRVMDERDIEVEHRREKVKAEMAKDYYKQISKITKKGMKDLLKIYRHHLIEIDWQELDLEDIDLEAEETWSKWGLSRSQLTIAGGTAGAAAGVAVDIGTGGLSHGAGTLLGMIGGAAAAFFKGDDLPDLKVDIAGGVKLDSGEGRKLELGPPKNANFPWILADRMLSTYQQVQNRAHGRRDKSQLSGSDQSVIQNITSAQRSTLGKWFISCGKGEPDRGLEPEVFKHLVSILEMLETEDLHPAK